MISLDHGIGGMPYNGTVDCIGKTSASERIRIISCDSSDGDAIQGIFLILSLVRDGHVGARCSTSFEVRGDLRQIYI